MFRVFVLLSLCAVPPVPVAGGDRLPETDWFSAAGHGVFTHYLSNLQNNFGRNAQNRNSSWDACINEFNATACNPTLPSATPTFATKHTHMD